MIHDRVAQDQRFKRIGHSALGNLPGKPQIWVALRELFQRERRNPQARFTAVEVGDDGVGQEFGVARAKLDFLEDELHDCWQTVCDFLAQLKAMGVNHQVECPASTG